MYSYAGTIVQLLNQLRMEGYSNQEIVQVVKSYKFALVVFTGQFQRSGKSQIEHGVGTASMLCALGAPAAVVAAGVIHNIYRIGDYGDGQRGITDLRRKETIGHVGVEVENPLHGFNSLMESHEKTGDGAGVLVQMPDPFMKVAAGEASITLPNEGEYASGLVFLPRIEAARGRMQ